MLADVWDTLSEDEKKDIYTLLERGVSIEAIRKELTK
jgi:hypothetical protein